MILSPFPGFFGPRAVITVVLGDVVSVEIKKKATPEYRLYIFLFLLDFDSNQRLILSSREAG